MQCPVCGASVAASRTACPMCNASLGASAGPGDAPALDPMLAEAYRASLSGVEAADAAMASTRGQAPPVPWSAAPIRATEPVAAPRRPAAHGSRANKTGAVVLTFVAVALVAGTAFGLWRWRSSRDDPQAVVRQYFAAVKTMDWGTLYRLTNWPDDARASYPTEESFVRATNAVFAAAGPQTDVLRKGLASMSNVTIGEPRVDGDTATVPISCTFTILGRTLVDNEPITLARIGGEWKVNPRAGLGAPGLGGGAPPRGMPSQ